MFKLIVFKILHNESNIICEVSFGNETKSNILILISVSGAKSLRIVENSESGNILALAIITDICCEDEEKVKRRKRKMWMKKWFANRDVFISRLIYTKLLKELKENHSEDFKNYMRMDDETLHHLLQQVKPYIIKQDTLMRDAIDVETRLSITLRFLANRNSFEEIFLCCFSAMYRTNYY